MIHNVKEQVPRSLGAPFVLVKSDIWGTPKILRNGDANERRRKRQSSLNMFCSTTFAARRFPSIMRPSEDRAMGRLKSASFVVDHVRGEYAVGVVHTQTVEDFWSIFKRGVVGTFHKVSAICHPLYVAEFQFRYNDRLNADILGEAIRGC
jgi:ISXO2-like transposase domain